MSNVWKWPPRPNFVDSLEWATDILSARDGSEDRVSYRATPRRDLALDYTISDEDATTARGYILGSQSFLVPSWPNGERIGAVAAGSGVATSSTYTGAAVLWQIGGQIEQVTVTAGVIATVTAPFTDAWLVPLLECVGESVSISREAAGINTVSTTMRCYTVPDESAASHYTVYSGHPLVHDAAVTGGGNLDENIEWPNEIIDNGAGVPVYVPTRDVPVRTFTASWKTAEIAALRGFLFATKGRLNPFWLPSWAQDFIVRSVSGSSITVSQHNTDDDHLYFSTPDGIVPRAIQGVTAVTGGYQLDLDAVVPSGFARCGYLRLVRFNSDRVEVQYNTSRLASVRVPCVRVRG